MLREELAPVTAGDFWQTPGGESHHFKAGPEGATVLEKSVFHLLRSSSGL